MSDRWYTKAIVYSLDIETFQDSDGDGCGDIPGLISRLDYLARLGVTCIWLSPIHRTPNRDDGYDVADFYSVDPRLGSLGDFAELLHRAKSMGIKVMIDLVVNHTSDEHPWFQSARSDPKSPYRDWYVWSDTEPADRRQGMVFPSEQAETWTYDRTAKSWYYHRFYDYQPDLNMANPAVRAELKKVVTFWTQLGVDGFRIDAAPFVIEQTEPGNADSPKDFAFLTELREHLSWRNGEAIYLAEANVEPDVLVEYFGDGGGSANRLHMLFDFMLNGKLMLALARQDAEPVLEAIKAAPKLPKGGRWATFLRNHDEVDLSRLSAEQRDDVFAAFGPEKNMQAYGRGIRRRLAPMLGNDRRRLELAYALQFSLRGTPVLRYGDEIGMGDDLSLPSREAVRTPMQWSAGKNAGFSTAPKKKLARPVITAGEYGSPTVNVDAGQADPGSLLSWFERMIRTVRQCPEVGAGDCAVLDVAVPRAVVAHKATAGAGEVLFVHNLGPDDLVLDLSAAAGPGASPQHVFADQDYPAGGLDKVAVAGHGYRWIRLTRDPGTSE